MSISSRLSIATMGYRGGGTNQIIEGILELQLQAEPDITLDDEDVDILLDEEIDIELDDDNIEVEINVN